MSNLDYSYALETLNRFLAAVETLNWDNAELYTLKSWKKTAESILSSIEIRSYQIKDAVQISNVCFDFTVILTYTDPHTLPHGHTQERTVKVIKELAPAMPSEAGVWGVSPLTVRYGNKDDKKKRTALREMFAKDGRPQ
jgi:hypothetical protein